MRVFVRCAVAIAVLFGVAAVASMANAEPVNQPPVANPGGPYVLPLGQNLVLDGSQSFDPDFPADVLSSFMWDLDGNGIIGDVSGVTLIVSWQTVWTFMQPAEGKMSAIALKVTDSHGQTSAPGETTVRFVPARPGGTVPEPTSTALVLLGTAFVAAMAGRRAKVSEKA